MLQTLTPITNYGIQPRNPNGLIGIVLSPFLHANLHHLITNTVGLTTFGLIFGLLEKKRTSFIVLSIIIVQGVLTWALARQGNHIGASGVIFGLFGYLLLVGLFRRRFLYVVVSVFTAFTYGSFIFGVLPTHPGVSWEGHLFGFFAGCLNARYPFLQGDRTPT